MSVPERERLGEFDRPKRRVERLELELLELDGWYEPPPPKRPPLLELLLRELLLPREPPKLWPPKLPPVC